MKTLIVPVSMPAEEATALAVANGCTGFYTGVPPKWTQLAADQAWTLPCIILEDEAGGVVSWEPV